MNEVIAHMLDRYESRSVEDYVRAIREILTGNLPARPLEEQVFREGCILRGHCSQNSLRD